MEEKWSKQNEAWERRLKILAKEVQLDANLIRTSRERLISYFGEEWLRGAHSRLKKFSPNDPHSVVGLITNPMDNNAVEVVELAKYLEAVNHQDNFDAVIAKLKNASDYEAIRLNLAVAYRLTHAGWADIYVEPDVGDVSGELFGKKYVVECSMIDPPSPAKNYAHEIFTSAYKYLKKNSYPVWIHVKFNKDFKSITLNKVTDAVKELNYRFTQNPSEPVETQTDEFSMTEIYLDERVKNILQVEKEKSRDSFIEIEYRLSRATPTIPGDIHSIDPEDPGQIDDGTITFGGMSAFGDSKTTAARIKTKIKDKKSQTASMSAGVRRIFVFMAQGSVDEENWAELKKTILSSTHAGDNLDAVLFMDRRRQQVGSKLRFVSAQIHFFTKHYRLRGLEASFKGMKDFENSDWIRKD